MAMHDIGAPRAPDNDSGAQLPESDHHSGHRLRIARLKAGMTQPQLADKLDTTARRLSRIERGVDPFPSEWTRILIAVLGLPPA